jgi:putative component of membrane protein insertase Oxa1/YidC/SpoIIIJ protein YidD
MFFSHLAIEKEYGFITGHIITVERVIRCPCLGENGASTALLMH